MKTGWILEGILENVNEGRFVNCAGYEISISGAQVFNTRQEARDNKLLGEEVVRKVELSKNDKAKKIIPGR